MIDIHCHILPGIDDGAQNLYDSLDMAKQAVSQGIDTIIATPHHMNGRYENRKADIMEKVQELNKRLTEEQIDLTILPGQENRIFGEILEGYEKGEIQTLADSSYVFIEFPTGHVPHYAETLLYDLQVKGLMPIIVHPERNSELMQNPDRLYEMVNSGTATQITAASLTGAFGKKIKKFGEQLIEANLTHFLASDAHNVKNRAFKMEEAVEEVEKKYGTDMLYFFTENAELLVNGQNIYREVPQPIKQKKLFGLF
ncbi:tyrosine-protein phosphatase [Heyndrickxia acidiproducens]|uniref:tyrosine-protein phosphatase n=1 Tax=Heyndrickxia acidiproducens TaxID=1121084 RepID=UPI00036D1F13|nr:CpsB/CapC family capsule biosynthesis tyrosine phosphatase [Heyndrickxia acidiproducens]